MPVRPKPKGFTMVELLTVIGIMVMLVALAIPSYNLMRRNVGTTSAAGEFVSTLRLAQARAMNGDNGTDQCVHYDGVKTYTVHQGICTAPQKVDYTLPSGTVFGSSGDVVFTHLTGSLTPAADVTITLKNGAGGATLKTISIGAQGKISGS